MMLSETVTVVRRFRRSVRIDVDQASETSEGFICTSTAAHALSTTAEQIAGGQGAFTWTGPYGCGKSSLAAVFAAALGPNTEARRRANQALPIDLAGRLAKCLRWTPPGWKVVPVVGRLADAQAAIAQVLDARDFPAGDVVARLVAASTAGGPGVLLVIDEMGKFLEHAAKGASDVHFFQELAEAASRSKGRLVVVGILHQAFDDYAFRLSRSLRDEWLKIQGRFADVPLNPGPGEQIDLVARAIETTRGPDASVAATAVATALHGQRDGSPAALSARLLEAWPLNPVVACLIGPLSRRRFGQSQRSLFGFLNSGEPFGFQDFLRSTPADGGLMYDVAWLWDYLKANLEPSIVASPDGHRWSTALDAVERCVGRGASARQMRLVKSIALIDMLRERSGLTASLDVLAAALPDEPAGALNDDIATLIEWSVVVHRRHLDALSLYAGSDFDMEAALAEARASALGVDFSRLRKTGALSPILAKRHYHETGAFRWFDVDVVAREDADARVARYKALDGASGLFLLVVDSVGGAGEAARGPSVASAACRPVALGSAPSGTDLRELTLDLVALEALLGDRPELKGDAVARRELAGRIAKQSADLEDALRAALAAAEWTVPMLEDDGCLREQPVPGPGRLSIIASDLADRLYGRSPRVLNELLNRRRPSSNAMAARRVLMAAMVGRGGEPRLGIEALPAEGGLYASLLERTGLHAPREGGYAFVAPSDDGARANLGPMWQAADDLFEEAGAAGAFLSALHELWRERPFGVKEGLLPVLGLAFLLSRSEQFSIYLDGVFCTRLGDLFVDRMLQDPGSVRLRRSRVSDIHAGVLAGIASVVAGVSGEPLSASDPLAIGRALVALVTGTHPWVQRTLTLGPDAKALRDLARSANDPNKFLLDDLPRQSEAKYGYPPSIAAIAADVGTGLRELRDAYPRLLADLTEQLLGDLRCSPGEAGLEQMRSRARIVKGATGDFTLDAFASRLFTFEHGAESIEGLTSLALSKPPREWVDRDISAARMKLTEFAQGFLRAEALLHVADRTRDGRTRLSVFATDPAHPGAVAASEVSVSPGELAMARELAATLNQTLKGMGVSREVAIAALAELARVVMDGHVAVPVRVDAEPRRRTRKAS